MAEEMGFEPTIRISPYNGLANRRLQPLGHPSAGDELLLVSGPSVNGSLYFSFDIKLYRLNAPHFQLYSDDLNETQIRYQIGL